MMSAFDETGTPGSWATNCTTPLALELAGRFGGDFCGLTLPPLYLLQQVTRQTYLAGRA